MQMVKRIVGGFFLALLLLWLFAPKQELYYLLEKSLKEKNIIISNETIKDTWIGLKIENADIYKDGIKIANSVNANFIFLFLFSQLEINNININEAFRTVAPKKIDNLKASYSIINPLNVTIKGEGSFGNLEGSVALLKRKIEIFFPNPKELKTIKKFLKKDATKGWYYETSY